MLDSFNFYVLDVFSCIIYLVSEIISFCYIFLVEREF